MERPVVGEMVRAGESLPGDSPLLADVLRNIRSMGPVTIRDLATFCAVSRRDVEAAVEELRLAGEPIVADNDGLRLTNDYLELEAYIEARRRRIASIYMGNRALRTTARRMREREELTLWKDVA